MTGFLKEKYPIVASYEDNLITRLKDFSQAESTEMPIMRIDLTWDQAKKKIEKAFHDYFENLLKEGKKN